MSSTPPPLPACSSELPGEAADPGRGGGRERGGREGMGDGKRWKEENERGDPDTTCHCHRTRMHTPLTPQNQPPLAAALA